MASTRRMGPESAATRTALMDATETVMREEGYAAVTSRRLGARAEVSPQLVHYYFRTMDELFVELFRRRAEANLQRVEEAIDADGSLRTLWELNADPRGAAFMIELVALANHRTEIRAEIARYAERFRAMQLDVMTAALEAAGVPTTQMPPDVALLLMTGVSQVMGIERGLGVTAGHEATASFLADAVLRLDPPAADGAP